MIDIPYANVKITKDLAALIIVGIDFGVIACVIIYIAIISVR